MKGFTVILRALLRGMFRKKAGRSGMTVSAIVGMLIAASIIAAVLSVVMGLLGNAAREYGLATEAVALLLAADFIITLVFGVTAVMSSMWSARDGEFFASLPASSNAVMLAKLTSAYIQDGAVSCILVLPPAITFGAVAGMGALYYVMTVLAIILVPLAALLLAAIISVPLAFVSGFFRNRGAAAAVLLLVFLIIFLIYQLVVLNQRRERIEYLKSEIARYEAIIESETATLEEKYMADWWRQYRAAQLGMIRGED